MVEYGLKNRVVLITGVHNPQGIGAAAALYLDIEKLESKSGTAAYAEIRNKYVDGHLVILEGWNNMIE